MPPDAFTPDPADRMNQPARPAPAARAVRSPDELAEGGKESPAVLAVQAERPKRSKRPRERKESPEPSTWPTAALDTALAAGPSSHTVSPALRSALRWPAAVLLFVCGLLHLPTDLAGLRSGGYAETLSVAVMVLCLVCAVWLAMRDTVVVSAAAAGLAVGVVALHALASAGAVDLLHSSLGESFTSARAASVLSAVAAALLTGSALVRRTRAAGAAHST
ncbi:hypothetical protein ACWD0A_33265 [Streptomyces sp. NPDC002867]